MTSTRVAVLLAVVLFVGPLVYDKSGPARNCTWRYTSQVGGGYTGECIPYGQPAPFGSRTTP